MSLRIKGTKDEIPEIQLKDSFSEITVLIDGTIIASFFKDGQFEFYGKNANSQYSGRWDQ